MTPPPDLNTAIKHPMVYIEMGFAFCFAIYGSFIAGCYKLYGGTKNALNDDNFLTLTGCLGSLANCSSRLFWEYL